MDTSKNKKINDSKSKESKESEELKNLDDDLNDLIDQNESLKKGISKIIKEIEKNSNQ